jgi:prevent-host-death family protein
VSARRPGSLASWSLQDAKNKLSAVVDAAARGAPQIVTRRGVETAVVISFDEFRRLTAHREQAPPSFADWLLDIPPAPGAGDDFERVDLGGRSGRPGG